MKIRLYENSLKVDWDEFILKSKNGTFLFLRDYMDYHSDRFQDNSVMIFDKKDKLLALLPANAKEKTIYSHGGLTYGGFITDSQMTTTKMIDVFNFSLDNFKNSGFTKFIYKTIPFIYHKSPSEEDRYPLFLYDAKLYRRDVLSVVFPDFRIKYQERRHRNIKKAYNNNLQIRQTDDYKSFWKILEWNLATAYNLKPVHSIDEIEMLAKRFKDIKLYASYQNDTMLAGLVIYESEMVAHNQYGANSEEGKKIGAVDIIYDHLINNIYRDKPFFDFGISNEKDGRYLNTGLVDYKESFGARTVVHDFYELNI